jgi:type VI secretion system protein ImpG
MDDDLLSYFNGELAFLREMGAEFAASYPKVAGRLQLEADRCADPHVERLLEGFALLTARVRKKIEDDFPEVTDALLNLLYPHYLRPLPSMSLVQFQVGPEQAKLTTGIAIPPGSPLGARAAEGTSCRFRTVYPVTLWPIAVAAARLDTSRVLVAGKPPGAVALLQLTLKGVGGVTFAQLVLDRLRFFLDGEGPVASALYELLINGVCKVLVRGRGADGRDQVIELPPSAIQPVGFGRDEGMFPYPARSFLGYRLLQEYFSFPEKFLFIDLAGLGLLSGRPLGDTVEVQFFLDRAPREELLVQPENFRLGCTPIVNLFSLVAEPIPLAQTQTEYRVVPDVHQPLATEVYSIDEVTCTAAFLQEPIRLDPIYAVGQIFDGPRSSAYWYATRRPSQKAGDPGSEVFLSFVDPGFNPRVPAEGTITVRASCTNRDLPSRLPYGGEQGDFELEAQALVGRARCLRKPTPPLRPRLGRGAQWRLISHLALNHLSLVDSDRGLEALRAILLLYDFADSAVTRQQIAGITRVSSRRVAGRTGRRGGLPVGLGVEVTVEFDESRYVGSGAFLLASVLERFLGLSVSINAFSQLVARTRQRAEILKRWPPRAGERTLL